MNIDQGKIISEIAKIKWFHTFNFGNGIVAQGFDESSKRIGTLQLPDDLTGMSVLDIGSWDGFFAFEAERRGASRVLATDSFCWGGEGWGTKDGFNLARNILNSKVEDLEIDVMELSPEKVGKFDLVLCLGVLYHMRHPLLALERVFSVTKTQLILETVVDCMTINRPVMAFYPGAELNNDGTNWCGPNRAAVEAMLKTVGFNRAEMVYQQFHGEPSQPIDLGRMTFHAWR